MKKTVPQKPVLTPADLTTLINTMKVVFPTRDEVREIVKEEIKFLPTKDEFFTRMDKLSGEIQKVRDEQTVHAGAQRDINDRFDRIDTHLHISTAD